MGLNLSTACHKCKVRVFHFRGEEQYTIIPFYYKHSDCLTPDAESSVETLEDQTQERDWMQDEEQGGYPEDTEIQHRHPYFLKDLKSPKKSTPMSETKTTYPCGCVVKTVSTGLPTAGTLTSYCDQHNPYKDSTPKVEVIS